MARNVEIKAHIASIETLEPVVARIADDGPIPIFQDDTFFPCANGRLKLRMLAQDEGELIFYRRPDQAGPKESFYVRTHTTEPAALRATLTLAYGVAGRVVKHRRLYLVGRTRVHLDRVDGLGDFLELEVVLAEDEPAQSGAEVAHDLMALLGIEPTQLIEGAYVELLSEQP